MNRIYRVIWNYALNQWVVTSEISRSKTKTKSSCGTKIAPTVITSLLALSFTMNTLSAEELLVNTPASHNGISLLASSSSRTGLTIGLTETAKYLNSELVDKGEINLNGTLELSGSGIFQNSLIGSAGGLFSIMKGSEITFDKAHIAYRGRYRVEKGADLIVTNANALGQENLLNLEGTLSIKDVTTEQFGNKFEGTQDSVIKLVNSDITIWGYSGGLTGFHGTMDIDKDSIYRFNTKANTFNIHHNLTGAGIYQIDIGEGSLFGFDWDTKLNEFYGTMALKSGIIDFNNEYNTFLNKAPNATIEVGDKGTLRIANGLEKQAKALTFNGGTIDFTSQQSGFEKLLIRENIHVTAGDHYIRVNDDLFTDNKTPSGNFFDQQLGTITQFIIQGNTASKEAGAFIHIYDKNGNPIQGKTSKIRLADQTGNAYYGVGKGMVVTDGKLGENGIGIGASLIELEADSGKNITVANRNDQTEGFGVKLSGKGGFTFNPDGSITLTNKNNQYEGETFIRGGRLVFGADNSFGKTNRVTLEKSGVLDLNRYSQTVAELYSDQSTALYLGSGALTLTGKGVIKGDLTSDSKGSLTLSADASLDIYSQNSQFLGAATVKKAAELIVQQHNSLGDHATIDLQGGILRYTGNANGAIDHTVTTSTNDLNSLIELDKNANIVFTEKVNHSLYSGSFKLSDNAHLTIKNDRALGNKESNKTTINDNATLIIDGVKGNFYNTFIGGGKIHLTNRSNLTLNGQYSQYSGLVSIDKDATFNIVKQEDYNLHHGLAGEGNLAINMISGKHFAISSPLDTQGFTGEVIMNRGILTLDSYYLNHLKQAGLTLRNQGVAEIGSGLAADGVLSALTLQGGVLDFRKQNELEQLKVGHLEVINGSTIQVKDLNQLNGHLNAGDKDFFEQQLGIHGEYLVAAGEARANSDNVTIKLIGDDGKEIAINDRDQLAEVKLDDQGFAYYLFKGAELVTGKQDAGIALNYGLYKLVANENQTIHLEDTVNVREFRVILQGDGSYTIKANHQDGILFGNGENNYVGNTTLQGGAITLLSNMAFGQKGHLILENDTNLDFRSFAQTQDRVFTDTNSTLNLNNASLLLFDGGEIKGKLLGGQSALLRVGKADKGTGELIIHQANRDFSGRAMATRGGNLILKDIEALGSAQIMLNRGHLTFSGINAPNAGFNNAVQGDIDSTVNITDNASILFDKDFIDHKGSFNILSGNLTIAHQKGLGAAAEKEQNIVTIGAGGTLQFKEQYGNRANQFKGDGRIELRDSQLSFTGDYAGFTGIMDLDSASEFYVNGANSLSKPYSVNHAVTGTGLFDVTLSGADHLLDITNKNSFANFEGNLSLQNAGIKITSDVVHQLSKATLVLNRGSIGDAHDLITKEDDVMHSLYLNGGTIKLGTNGGTVNTLYVDKLNLTAGSTIMVDPNIHGIDIESINSEASYFDQQFTSLGSTLISAKELMEDINNISINIVDYAGNSIASSNDTQYEFKNRAGELVGVGYYQYKGIAANGKKGDAGDISLSYGLSKLEANEGFSLDIDRNENVNELGVILTGKGGFNFEPVSGKAIYVGNSDSDYQGETSINNGKVYATADNAFGQTSALILEDSSEVHLQRYKQKAGEIKLGDNSLLDLGIGEITLTNGDTTLNGSSATLAGEVQSRLVLGDVASDGEISSSNVIVNGTNDKFQGLVVVRGDNKLEFKDQNALSKARIHLQDSGEFILDFTGRLQNTVTGQKNTMMTIASGADVIMGQNFKNSAFLGTYNILGEVELDNVVSIVRNDMIGNGVLHLTNNSMLKYDGDFTESGSNNAGFTGTVNIDSGSIFGIVRDSNYTLQHDLQGKGEYFVSLQEVDDGKALSELDIYNLNLSTDHLNQFEGMINLDAGRLTFDKEQLTDKMGLTIGRWAKVAVDDHLVSASSDKKDLRSLVLKGGELTFSSTGKKVTPLVTTDLHVEGENTLIIDNLSVYREDNAFDLYVDQADNLLDQQENFTGQWLVKADNATTDLGSIILKKSDGSEIELGESVASSISGGIAYYNYNGAGIVTDGSEQGISVSYGLTRLDAALGKMITISNEGSTINDLNVMLSGAGGFVFQASHDKGLTIGNSANRYLGKTSIESGTVTVASNNAFGFTSELKLGDDVTLHFGNIYQNEDGIKRPSYMQIVGKLLTSKSSELNLYNSELIVEDGAQLLGSLNIGNGDLTLEKGGLIEGALTANNNGQLLLQGGETKINSINKQFSGIANIDNSATLTLGNSEALGNARIHNDGVLNLMSVSNDQGIFDNYLAGGLSANVNIVNSSDITLTQDNRDYLGSFSIENQSALTVTDNFSLGIYNRVTNLGTLNLVGLTGQQANHFDGSGEYNLENSQIDLSADFSADMGNINLKDHSQLIITGDYNDYTNTISVDQNSKFIINKTADQAGDYSINHGLSGNGIVDVTLADNHDQLMLGSNKIHGFKGNLVLNKGEINLDQSNDHIGKLSEAILTLKSDAAANIGKQNGSDKLNELALIGGTIHFAEDNPDTLAVGRLTVESGSAIMLKDESIVADSNVVKDIDESIALIDQQSGVIGKILVQADELDAGSVGSQVLLVDENGVEIKSGAEASLDIDGGKAYYDYKGIYVANNEGTKGAIALSYGLTKLEADPNLSITITNSQYTGGKENHKLAVILTGDGGFTFENKGVLYVGNDKSDYKGDTLITGGTLFAASDNAFGQTSLLELDNDARVNLINHSQTVGEIKTSEDSLFKIESGHLTVTNGGEINGRFEGKSAGKLTVTGGSLTVNSSNKAYDAKTTVSGESSELILTQVDALGTASIGLTDKAELTYKNISSHTTNGLERETIQNSIVGDDGTRLNIENSHVNLIADNSEFKGTLGIDDSSEVMMNDAGMISGNIENEGDLILNINHLKEYDTKLTGTGRLIKVGSGDLNITTDQQYDGAITIMGGAIDLDEEITFNSSNKIDLLGGNLILQDKATLIADDGLNVYSGSFVKLLGEESRLQSDISIHADGALGGYGTIDGDVTNAGTIYVGSRLFSVEDDITGSKPESGLTGNLTINGDYHGSGALSSLYFGSEYSDDSSISDHLTITGVATGHSNVYVNSIKDLGKETDQGIELIKVVDYADSDITFTHKGRTVGGIYEYTLQKGDDGRWYLSNKSTGNPIDPTNPSDPGISGGVIRPEVGGYLANQMIANRLFTHSLHDREYVDGDAGTWVRMDGSFSRTKDSSKQIRTKTDSYSVQLGIDIFSQTLNGNPFKFGVMGGFGSSKSKMHNEFSKQHSKADSDGFALGLYGTLGNVDRHYIDTWIQYVYMDNKIKGNQLAQEKYKSKGFIASIEGGYAFNLTESFYLQPQAQLTYMGVKSDQHREANGTVVKSSRNNVQLRLGARLFSEQVLGNDKIMTPYMEVNYIHNSKPTRVYFDDYVSEQRGARNIGEVKLGLTSEVGNHFKVWGDLSHSRGSDHYRDTKVSAGVRYTF